MARWDEDGFSSCSTCPCHRAAPNHPAGVADRLVSARPVMLPSPVGRGLGLRNHFLSRPPLGSLALRPGDSLAIPRMASSVGFIRFVSSTDATQATKVLTFPPVGLSPTEHASLCWTHSFANIPSDRKTLTCNSMHTCQPCSCPSFVRSIAPERSPSRCPRECCPAAAARSVPEKT